MAACDHNWTINYLIWKFKGPVNDFTSSNWIGCQENRAGMNTSCGNSLSEANVCKPCFLGIGGIYRIEQVSQSG